MLKQGFLHVTSEITRPAQSPLNLLCFTACLYRAVKPCWPQRGVREDGVTSVTQEQMPVASEPQLMQHHLDPFKEGLSEMGSNKATEWFLCLSGKRRFARRPVFTFRRTDSCQKGRGILHVQPPPQRGRRGSALVKWSHNLTLSG